MKEKMLIQELKDVIFNENGNDNINYISVSYCSRGNQMHMNVDSTEIEISGNDIELFSENINAIFSIKDKEVKKEFDGIGDEYIFLDKTEEIRLSLI